MTNQTNTQAYEDAALEKRREHLKNESTRIIEMANNEDFSALRCIHQLSVAGGATDSSCEVRVARSENLAFPNFRF